ncbi:MerR family transcriptional regulator [Tsukamurella sp. 8F]|uniref:MerR family transcriptional regulator n=1 Tax=unclassified Tsukamurella TaxID=2633480 RepID=UPI0023B94B58|nr:MULTISPECIES: MerR family transcriptional regulator [unclassified Tsukamurella]MDF0532625.1 MerR family transcriptional regulator [Tsukamurella sp. 8J]MDF0589514.1 MerR family transcriptional regulator [Tsukamurella sp. 8F]
MYRIGEVADATGLTVRTLHHYDEIGLVTPAARSTTGHRLYADADLRRLYVVSALRQMGVPLAAAASVLDGAVPLGEVLGRQLEYLDEQVAVLSALRSRVSGVLASLERSPVDSSDLLDLIRKVNAVDEVARKYFTNEQLAGIERRVDPQQASETTRAWGELIPQVQRAIDGGVDPASAEAAGLAERWMALLQRFHGGDDEVREGLYRMQRENAAEIRRDHGGPSPEQIEFIQAANRAR